jgi:hypothetical protein
VFRVYCYWTPASRLNSPPTCCCPVYQLDGRASPRQVVTQPLPQDSLDWLAALFQVDTQAPYAQPRRTAAKELQQADRGTAQEHSTHLTAAWSARGAAHGVAQTTVRRLTASQGSNCHKLQGSCISAQQQQSILPSQARSTTRWASGHFTNTRKHPSNMTCHLAPCFR